MKDVTRRVHFSFTHEHEKPDGSIDTLRVLGNASFVHDPNFGADADGNRGVPRWDIDELNFAVFNGRGMNITDKLELDYQRVYRRIEYEAEEAAFTEFDKARWLL